MATFKNFTFEESEGKFRLSANQSVLVSGAEFTLTECVTGVFKNEEGAVINKDGVSIRFKTSLSSNIEDAINLNKLLHKRKIVYSDKGRAEILYDFADRDELINFLVKNIGKDADDGRFLKGTAKEIGNKIIDFYKDKTFVVEEVENVFFKEIKDGVEKLVLPYSPVTIIKIKD